MTVGEICDVVSGYAFDSKLFSENPGDMPLVRIRDVTRGYTNTYTKEAYDEKFLVRKGDLLIGMDGEFNIAPWKSGDALLNQRVCKISCSSGEVLERYLLYFLPKALKEIEESTSFVTVKHLSVKTIREINVPLPPFDEQLRMARTLDSVGEALEKRKQQLVELERLKRSTFYYLFGDPAANDKHWELKRLDQLCENLDSRRVPITSTDRKSGPYPYYGASGIVDYVEDYLFDGEFLLVSEDGANLLARTTPIAFSISGKSWVNNHAHVLRFESYALQQYIEHAINLTDISKYVTGSAQPKLNQAKLNGMLFPHPPIEMLEKFAGAAARIEEQRVQVQQAVGETQALFDSLISTYFGLHIDR